ncbi:acetyltransferase [Weizmannia acidilactici]|uniref:Acetyltransferase n=1 Tax=Weizmannia acidilactici TaxID=2607726 RepID=A0A5J4J3Z7_9BACI|nr:acyltransferase [Weizmannia acidilactici]GER65949.1 acetyltransferase [Weizmannia acidilactici]GER69722.1 acetyltransferase [Weizmannia acidilactici]GER74405.1 acetyltransferase [Weizmannia acidilactici]
MRKTERYPVEGANALWQIYKTVSFWKVLKNVIIIEIARYMPFLRVKNWMYRTFLCMKVGDKTAFAYKVLVDIMFPEKISVGKNCVIGYNTTILAHEYLIDEYRIGEVVIGDEVMVGANTTILPGVVIGDRAVVAAGSVVHKDVPAGSFAGGNPLQIIREAKERPEQTEQ